MSDESETETLIKLIEQADLVMLVFGEKKAALGPDIVKQIVEALRFAMDHPTKQ